MGIFKRKSKNKKWQQRRQLYKGRYYYLKQISRVLFGMTVLASLVVGYMYFQNSEAISIKNIEVLGDLKQLSEKDIIRLSDIKKGDKLFGVSFSKIQDNISRHPWTAKVKVRREFPDTVQIHVTERKPIALVLVDGFYLVDEAGNLFKKVSADEKFDLPVITGITFEQAKEYPHLTQKYFNEVFSFLRLVSKQDFYKQQLLSEIQYDPIFGVTVFTSDSGLEVYYGLGSYRAKHKKLEKFKLSEQYKKQAWLRIDLDVHEKVVARAFNIE
jgi:cell division protein FtsQ